MFHCERQERAVNDPPIGNLPSEASAPIRALQVRFGGNPMGKVVDGQHYRIALDQNLFRLLV